MKKVYILTIAILSIVMSALIMVNSEPDYALTNNVENVSTEEMIENDILIQGEILTDKSIENMAYEKTESITIPRNIVVKDGETIDIILPPVVIGINSDRQLITAKAEDDISDAYINDDGSMTIVLTDEQLESRIKKVEDFTFRRISELDSIDVHIDDDFRCVNYYLKDKVDFPDFMFDRGNIEQMVFAAQVFSGIDYTNCYIYLNVIDAKTEEVLFEYNADAYGIYDLPTQEEWNEKLGITDEDDEDK